MKHENQAMFHYNDNPQKYDISTLSFILILIKFCRESFFVRHEKSDMCPNREKKDQNEN